MAGRKARSGSEGRRGKDCESVGEVPMENVELIVAHGANGAEEVRDGEEVAGGVEEEAAVGKKRAIGDQDPDGERLRGAPGQLEEGLKAAHGVPGGGSREMGRGAGRGDGEGIGLVRGGGGWRGWRRRG